ncbi:MAG: RNA methyltransferase [Verrucomicrobiota bacterium]|nr:RNA methyltransferase [Verrucomicrobiota bacterium]
MNRAPTIEYIYGLNPAFEVLRAGRRTVTAALINQASLAQPRMQKLVALLKERKITIHHGEKGRLIDAARSGEHQGVVLEATSYPYSSLEEVSKLQRVVLLDNIEDPHNVGAILRSAEVFGFTGILVPNKGTPEIYPSVVKTSAGASEFLHICRDNSSVNYAKRLLDNGFNLIALDMHGKITLDEVTGLEGKKLCLVIGGEDLAIGRFIINAAQHVVSMRQYGKVNSLNASVAAAIALHHIALRFPQAPATS